MSDDVWGKVFLLSFLAFGLTVFVGLCIELDVMTALGMLLSGDQ